MDASTQKLCICMLTTITGLCVQGMWFNSMISEEEFGRHVRYSWNRGCPSRVCVCFPSYYVVMVGHYIHDLQPPYISFLVYYTQAFLQFPSMGIQNFWYGQNISVRFVLLPKKWLRAGDTAHRLEAILGVYVFCAKVYSYLSFRMSPIVMSSGYWPKEWDCTWNYIRIWILGCLLLKEIRPGGDQRADQE